LIILRKNLNKPMSENKRYPELTAGAIVYNDKNEILFIQNKKWGKWSIPGGHIEIGEKAEDIVRPTLDSKKGHVTLATVHAIKGLEAETVFVLGCNELNFPCKASDHPVIEMIKLEDLVTIHSMVYRFVA